MAEEKQDKKRIYCNCCRSDTWHSLYGSHESHKRDEENNFYDERKFRLWACNGCDEGTLEEVRTWGPVGCDPEMEDSKTSYYPKRAHADLASKHFIKLPEKLKSIYSEVIQAFNHNLRVLCASGLRSLVEGICEEKGITDWSIEKKIEGLRKHLPDATTVDNLHGFRFMGKRAMHDLEAPSRDDLRLAIGVVEDLLNFLYELDYRASLLGQKLGAGKGGTPPKPKP